MTNLFLTNDLTLVNAITHTGVSHADDVMVTAILLKLRGELTLMRTFKVPGGISEDVIIYDIGGGKYDHHQTGGNGGRKLDPPYKTKDDKEINEIPYSSVGLIWRDFGRQIISETEPDFSEAQVELVWTLIDRDLISGIDVADNGKLPQADYPVQGFSLYQVISSFNPNWDSGESFDDAFVRAVEFAGTVFDNVLANACSKVKGQRIVDEAIEVAEGQIMILDRFVPWQDFIFASRNAKAEEILFVVFPALRGGFNCQCVPDTLGGKGQRKSLPENWRGLPAEKLQEVSGVETAIFCHPGAFMCSAQTQEDAIKMAKLAIEA